MTATGAAARVIVLTTGGTIGHRSKGGVAVMDFDPKALLAQLGLHGVDLDLRDVFRKGSMDIVPSDWQILAAAAADALNEEPRGVVILHGTDTMHYTAAALSFMLRDLAVPLVLTGSMIPGGDDGSDSSANLADAIRVAATFDVAEVCIVFSADAQRSRGVILRGNRARKIHSTAIDAFASINAAPLGYLENGQARAAATERRRRQDFRRIAPMLDLDRSVALVKLTPAMTPNALKRCLQGAAGAVLEGTGVGHIRTDLQETVAAFGRPAVVTTQAVAGGERLGLYDVDRSILAIPNVIPGGDMTSETALVKLMWALKQGGNIRDLMQESIAGELTPRRMG